MTGLDDTLSSASRARITAASGKLLPVPPQQARAELEKAFASLGEVRASALANDACVDAVLFNGDLVVGLVEPLTPGLAEPRNAEWTAIRNFRATTISFYAPLEWYGRKYGEHPPAKEIERREKIAGDWQRRLDHADRIAAQRRARTLEIKRRASQWESRGALFALAASLQGRERMLVEKIATVLMQQPKADGEATEAFIQAFGELPNVDDEE